MTLLWLLFLSTWNIANSVDLQNAPDELSNSHGEIIFSSILFRHGDRTPGYFYPKVGFKDNAYHEGKGQLTKPGKKLLYGLGKWLNARYIQTLLNEGYRYDRVRVDSSDTERTLESAQLVLAGLFPPSGPHIWNEQLKWMPIAVHTKPREMDELIAASFAPCARYDMEKKALNESDEWKAYYKTKEKIFNDLVTNSGITVEKDNILKTIRELSYVVDTVHVMKSNYTFTLQDWEVKLSEDTVNEILKKHVEGYVGTDVMQRLRIGPWFASIIDDMKMKVEKKEKFPRVLHLYAGHDVNVGGVLFALKDFQRQAPYGSALIVELRVKEGEYYVTILYKESPDDLPRPILVPGCGENCTLENFIKQTKHITPVNWQDECDMKMPIEIEK